MTQILRLKICCPSCERGLAMLQYDSRCSGALEIVGAPEPEEGVKMSLSPGGEDVLTCPCGAEVNMPRRRQGAAQ